VQESSTERVGRYQLLEPIGGGPNGSVARAKVFGVAGFERQFAIKRFTPELTASPAAAQALSAAARAYGSLEHPRIARMAEFGVAQGQTFTAVELVTGLDVMRLLAESRLGGSTLPAGGSLALISQAARAVGYAHGRGLSHLGLAPTNVIVTGDGDVKVTDFGILAATTMTGPVETPRFAHRIGYLAPEQLAGEATSAATDVFVLGVMAYELVTGTRAFLGDSPQAIARAILAGPPAEPPLPRPIVRVLARCLARSQFERFPDARAFADALDAALRVAPVPGTRKDLGAQVKATLERHAAMHEGDLSGMVALNLTPMTAPARPHRRDLELADAPEGSATTEFVRPDLEIARPAPLVGPARRAAAGSPVHDPSATMPELPKLRATMPGLAPPAVPPLPSPAMLNPATMLGGPGAGKKPMLPSIKPPLNPPPRGIPSFNAGEPGSPGLASSPQIGKPAIPNLRQTRPGSAPPPHRELEVVLGRPTRNLVGPIPGLGEPVSPASDPDATRPGPEARSTAAHRPSPEGDVATMPGDDDELHQLVMASSDFGVELDAETRPGPRVPLAPRVLPEVLDDPPTARHDVLPEVHARGGLMPFVQRQDFEPEPTASSPSIEIIGASPDGGHGKPAISAPPSPREMTTSQLPTALARDLMRASRAEDPIVEVQLEAHARGSLEAEHGRVSAKPDPVSPQRALSPSPPSLVPSAASDRTPGTVQPLASPVHQRAREVALPWQAAKAGPARWPIVVGVLVVLGAGAGIVAWQLQPPNAPNAAPGVPAPGSAKVEATGPITSDAAGSVSTRTTGSATRSNAGSAVAAGSSATATPANPALGAGSDAKPLGAGSGAKPVVASTASSDALAIASTPGGARVFIDGAEQGVTPVKLSGSSDRHTMALMLPGHELYVAEVDGHGSFQIPLKPVTPTGGRAGIKVLKCKDKARYYIFVDGKPSGMTCPSARINTTVGPHTVEVYDLVTETRRKWDVNVADERLSYRVRVD
jgi:serine/threonine protein kinase